MPQFCTEASIVLLMVGTLIGGIAQVGEVRCSSALTPPQPMARCKIGFSLTSHVPSRVHAAAGAHSTLREALLWRKTVLSPLSTFAYEVGMPGTPMMVRLQSVSRVVNMWPPARAVLLLRPGAGVHAAVVLFRRLRPLDHAAAGPGRRLPAVLPQESDRGVLPKP